MRLERRNLVLLGLLVALVALDRITYEPDPVAQAGEPLLAGFDPARVARVEIHGPGGEAGSVIVLTLARGAEGWELPGLGGFPALAFPVDELLRELRTLTTSDRVGAEAASHAFFGVGQDAARIVLRDASGGVLGELLQGRPPDGDALRGSYVRPIGSDEVVRAVTLAPLDPDPKRWLDARLLAFDPREVVAFSVRQPEEDLVLELERRADGRWTGSGRTLTPAQVDPVLRAAAALPIAGAEPGPAGEAVGLGDPPRLSLVLELGEGLVRETRIGAVLDDTDYAVTDPAWREAWIARVPGGAVARLERALAGLAGR